MSAVDRYPSNKILMMGDAPGDMAAAQAIGCNFFPILPGNEVESWERFMDDAYTLFLNGGFPEEYQKTLIKEFMNRLPGTPPWKINN